MNPKIKQVGTGESQIAIIHQEATMTALKDNVRQQLYNRPDEMGKFRNMVARELRPALKDQSSVLRENTIRNVNKLIDRFVTEITMEMNLESTAANDKLTLVNP